VKTHFARTIWENEEFHRRTVERTPLGRIGVPEDITGLALYLASPASDFATGEVFVIDGGLMTASF
jgi:NAD(P)-dependent dehydrogenase (short-subunit alcohol dehydrogenase family)